jgi:protein SDA1
MTAPRLQGTANSKKKKIRKLKRVMGTIKKSKRRGETAPADLFAAMQLLHDPHAFAERLFARCASQPMRFETRLVMLQVRAARCMSEELVRLCVPAC